MELLAPSGTVLQGRPTSVYYLNDSRTLQQLFGPVPSPWNTDLSLLRAVRGREQLPLNPRASFQGRSGAVAPSVLSPSRGGRGGVPPHTSPAPVPTRGIVPPPATTGVPPSVATSPVKVPPPPAVAVTPVKLPPPPVATGISLPVAVTPVKFPPPSVAPGAGVLVSTAALPAPVEAPLKIPPPVNSGPVVELLAPFVSTPVRVPPPATAAPAGVPLPVGKVGPPAVPVPLKSVLPTPAPAPVPSPTVPLPSRSPVNKTPTAPIIPLPTQPPRSTITLPSMVKPALTPNYSPLPSRSLGLNDAFSRLALHTPTTIANTKPPTAPSVLPRIVFPTGHTALTPLPENRVPLPLVESQGTVPGERDSVRSLLLTIKPEKLVVGRVSRNQTGYSLSELQSFARSLKISGHSKKKEDLIFDIKEAMRNAGVDVGHSD